VPAARTEQGWRGQRKTPPERGFPDLASWLLLAVSKETQEEQEEVDEVEIETQGTHDGVATGHLTRMALVV